MKKERTDRSFRRIAAGALTAVMLISGIGPSIPAKAVELESVTVANAGFEIKTSWTNKVPKNWSGANCSEEQVHSGTYSAKVNASGTLVSDAISVTGGALYTVGGYIYTTDKEENGNAYIMVYQFDGDGNALSGGESSVSSMQQRFYGNTTEWQQFQTAVQLEKETATIKIGYANEGAGTLYVDDVYLTQNSAATTGTEVNADFETVTTQGDYSFPTGWQLSSFAGPSLNGSLETPEFYSSTEHFHSGGRSLYFAKTSFGETTRVENKNTFEVSKDGYYEYTWGMWVKSFDSDAMLRLDMVVYDADGNQLSVMTGDALMLSRGETVSGWQYISTSAEIPDGAAKASFRIVATEGTAKVYVDDLFCKPTRSYYEKVVDWSDFHAVTESGEIAGWTSTGTLSAAANTASLAGGLMNRKLTTLVPSYGYQLSVSYTAASAAEFGVKFYDVNDQCIDEESITLAAKEEMTGATLEFYAPEDTYYGVFEFGGTGSYTLSEFILYETTAQLVDSDWTANTLWYPEDSSTDANWQYRFFRHYFTVQEGKEIASAYVQVAADDSMQENITVNGTWVNYTEYQDGEKRKVYIYDIKDTLKTGTNVMAISALNVSLRAGVVFEGEIFYTDGTSDKIISGVNGTTYVSKLDCTTSLGSNYSGDNGYGTFIKNHDTAWKAVDYDMEGSGFEWVEAARFGVPPHGALAEVSYCYDYTGRLSMNTSIQLTDTQNVIAGDTVTIAATAGGYNQTVEQIGLESRTLGGKLYNASGSAVATIPVTLEFVGNIYNIRFTFQVPDYIAGDGYKLYLDRKELGINYNSKNQIAILNITQADKANIKAEVKKEENGTAGLYIEGEKTSPILYLRPFLANLYDYGTMSRMKESGISLYCTYDGNLDGADQRYTTKRAVWTGMDAEGNPELDYDIFDYEILRTLDLNQDAKVMVNICMDAPTWWLNENPDEAIKHHNGDYIYDSSGNRCVSMASTKYSEDAAKVVTALVQHMQTASYSHRVFAVRLVAGRTFEWMYDGVESGVMVDYSNAAATEFRNYLTKIYGTDEALQKAWGNGSVTLATAAIPTGAERVDVEYIALVDTETERNVIDYNNFLGQISADRLLDYAKAAKSVNADWLVGGYNGYLWAFDSSEGIGSAHSAVSDVLSSDYIDFLSSPVCYSERISGYATGYMAMSDSLAANGKLYILEQDNRTLHGQFFVDIDNGDSVGLCHTSEESVQQLRRDMSFDYVQGNGFWLFDMEGGWFNDASIYTTVRTMKEEYDKNWNLGSNNEVAVFVSEKNYSYIKGDIVNGNTTVSHYLLGYLYKEQRRELAAMGASYDAYSIEDLCNGIVEKEYKLNIILSPFELTDEQRTAIDEKLKKNGKTVLWVYMPGAAKGTGKGSYSAENISELIDMDIVLKKENHPLQAEVTAAIKADGTNPVGSVYGNASNATGPWLYVNDTKATTLAEYATGNVAAAYKVVEEGENTYTSVYSAVPDISADMLRNLCEYAGVHIYSKDASDIIQTNNNYIALHSAIGGEKTITLPAIGYSKCKVYDVFAGQYIEKNEDGTFTYTHAAGDTRLFRLEGTSFEDNKTEVSIGKVTDYDLELTAVLTEAASMKLADVYGEGAVLTGKVEIQYEDKSSTEKMNFTVAEDKLLIKGINPKDVKKITIAANTQLTPAESCYSLSPIRITNDIVWTYDISEITHSYTESITKPTCTEQGYTTYTCKDCEYSYKDNYTDALGHSWDEGTVTKKATCTEKGEKTWECIRGCKTTKTEDIPIKAHNYEKSVTAPTCTEQGYTTYTCKDCKHSYKGDDTKALGHSWDEGTVTKKATASKDGKIEQKCKRCQTSGATTVINYPAQILLSKTEFTYNGKKQKPTVSVKDKNGKVISADNYTVNYKGGCTDAGSYKVEIVFKGNYYEGTVTKTYKITAQKIKSSNVKLSVDSYTYNGKAKKQSVTVKDSGKKKVSSKYYKVTYSLGRKKVGTYKVTIKLKGNYSGKITKNFKINPPKAKLSKVTPGSKALQVKWFKQSKQTTGYQIQYSTNKKFKSAVTKKVKSYKTTSLKLTNLKAKKTYYVRIRTYKTVKGKTYYSDWSEATKRTTK